MDKKISKKIIYAVILVLIIAVASYLTYYFVTKEDPNKGRYNGFDFEKNGPLWHTVIFKDGKYYDVSLRYAPWEVELIPINGNPDVIFKYMGSYITFNPEEENQKYNALAAYDLSSALINVLDMQPVAACTKNVTEACYNQTIVDCDFGEPTIYLKYSNETSINVLGECIVVSGNDMDLIKSADRLLYHWYGII